MISMKVIRAADALHGAVLRAILAIDHARDEDPHADAAAEHAAEQVALAARELVRAVDASPEDEWPIGWDATPADAPVGESRLDFMRLDVDAVLS